MWNIILKAIAWFLNRLFPPVPVPPPEISDAVDLPEEAGIVTTVAAPSKGAATTPLSPHVLVILDPGHGPATQGKRSPVLPDGTRFFEYQFNWNIADMAMSMLADSSYDVRCTHHEWDKRHPNVPMGNSLRFRADVANEWWREVRATHGAFAKAYFISIHSNAAPTPEPDAWCDPNIRGVEAWFYHYSHASRQLAQLCHGVLQERVIPLLNTKDRGLKSTPDINRTFYVLRKTTMPATLLEIGFYNNFEEVLLLRDPDVQQEIAKAIVEIIDKLNKNNQHA